MHTPDSPEAIEAGFSRFMADLPRLLAGRNPRQKKMVLARLLGEIVFSSEHETLGYWTVSTVLGSGIFSLERDTFLEFPEGKGVKKYFNNITSKGVVTLSDGKQLITLCFGGDRITSKEILRIERLGYIENGSLQIFRDLPEHCSLQMALNIFTTKRNETIARSKQEGDSKDDSGE